MNVGAATNTDHSVKRFIQSAVISLGNGHIDSAIIALNAALSNLSSSEGKELKDSIQQQINDLQKRRSVK